MTQKSVSFKNCPYSFH